MSFRDDFVAYTGQDYDDRTPHQVKVNFSQDDKRKIHNESQRRDTLTGEIILTKDGTNDDIIDIDDIRQKIAHLRANAHVKIRHLSGQLKEDFDSLAQYVAWIYNTDSYPLLYAEIQNKFNGDEIYQPGTVGAYCGGCLVKKNGFLNRGCTVICAGSIPPPYEDPEWDFCSELVIWAVYNNGVYEFTTLNEVEDEQDDKAIIFIEHETVETFPGFTEVEKKTLTDHGIREVRLVYYNSKGETTCKEVSTGFVMLDQVKTRQDAAQSSNTSTTTSTTTTSVTMGWYWWWIVIIAIILIALFFALCRSYQKASC